MLSGATVSLDPKEIRVGVVKVGIAGTKIEVWDKDSYKEYLANSPAWKENERQPGPLETSLPNVFAAGDVRSGSVKRCAAAVGEGGMAIAGVQIALAASADRN